MLVVGSVGRNLLALVMVLRATAALPPHTSAPVRTPLPEVATHSLITPQTLVSVDGGRRLNLLCMGSGSPTVLLDSGTGGGIYDWRLVQAVIAQGTTACSYDRAGYGFSDPAAHRSDAINAVRDLHNLIVNGGLKKPIILAGHSNGGIYAVLYAETYPEDLAGMVLVDPGFTGQQNFDAYGLSARKVKELEQGNARWIRLARHCMALAESGALSESENAASPCTDNPPNHDPLLHASLDRQESKPAYYKALLSEFESTFLAKYGATLNDREVPLKAGSLGELPLIVLTAGRHPAAFSDFTDQDQAKYYLYWKNGHDRLAALSRDGRNITVSDSGHFIQIDQPAIVVRYILELVKRSHASYHSAEPDNRRQ